MQTSMTSPRATNAENRQNPAERLAKHQAAGPHALMLNGKRHRCARDRAGPWQKEGHRRA